MPIPIINKVEILPKDWPDLIEVADAWGEPIEREEMEVLFLTVYLDVPDVGLSELHFCPVWSESEQRFIDCTPLFFDPDLAIAAAEALMEGKYGVSLFE